jgi:MGT family glycosyltransferase
MYATFVDTWFADLWPMLSTTVHATRDSFGLPPVDGWPGVFAPHDRLISVVPSRFEPPIERVPATLRHFGFLVPLANGGEPPPLPVGNDPLVVVGLSTTYQHQEKLMHTIVDALRSLPVRALVTTGIHIDADTVSAPSNVAVTAYVPHSLVMPGADVVVTHAGLGTVAAALHYGVPLVCTPIGRDQFLNAGRVAAVGAGITLGPTADRDQVAECVRAVLADSGYRRAAGAMARESAAEGGAAAAAADLEALAAP